MIFSVIIDNIVPAYFMETDQMMILPVLAYQTSTSKDTI